MPYLVDSNVLIAAKRNHYRFGTFPCFWDWIVAQHANGKVFSVKAVEKEILDAKDDLSTWIAKIPTAFLPPDAATAVSAATLTAWVQDPARIFTPSAVSDFFSAADYWLVAHAAAHGFSVVTHEVADPYCRRRVKIPDACNALGVTWLDPFDMLAAESASF
jgi:predicted nucleic acid-binding protein